MRLFVAVEASDATRAGLRALRARLEPRLAASRPPRVTWVNPDTAHVTLRFLGEVADDLAPALVSALAPEFPVAPFDVRFDRLGAFPGVRRPQAIWIGASGAAGSACWPAWWANASTRGSGRATPGRSART